MASWILRNMKGTRGTLLSAVPQAQLHRSEVFTKRHQALGTGCWALHQYLMNGGMKKSVAYALKAYSRAFGMRHIKTSSAPQSRPLSCVHQAGVSIPKAPRQRMKAQVISQVCSLSQSSRELLIEQEKGLNAEAAQRSVPELRPWNQANLASYPSSVTLNESGVPEQVR